jgi:hypothetical protein
VFGRIDPHLRRSITFDNDTAFAQHAQSRRKTFGLGRPPSTAMPRSG